LAISIISPPLSFHPRSRPFKAVGKNQTPQLGPDSQYQHRHAQVKKEPGDDWAFELPWSASSTGAGENATFPLHSLGSNAIHPNTNMAKALSKSQIVASLAETIGLTKKQAVQTMEALVALAYKNAKNSFTIPGLGKIVLVNRKARMGRNPATGETIKIAAKRVVKFRVAKAAKDAILGSK
jgi:DNA-binding protein HU-beta